MFILKFTKFIIFVLFFQSLLTSAQAQQETILDYFEATENQEKVLLKWAISRGETCNGISITRSTDSLFFESIGRIEGVCGSPEFQQPYSFVDEAPLKNQKNYYKLELGTSDFSNVISIKIIEKNEEGYQVIPQPIRNKGKIYFNNPDYEKAVLQVFQLNGQQLYEETSQVDYFKLHINNYPQGLYLFSIHTKNQTIKGKFIKVP